MRFAQLSPCAEGIWKWRWKTLLRPLWRAACHRATGAESCQLSTVREENVLSSVALRDGKQQERLKCRRLLFDELTVIERVVRGGGARGDGDGGRQGMYRKIQMRRIKGEEQK